jgi:DUF4097 and DUF4098 domain-containing protein YvlB
MKKYIKYFPTAILCIMLTATAFPQESDDDHFTIPLSDPSREATVKVAIFRGSMTIEGYDGKEVIVDMEYGGNHKPRKLHQADTTGLKKIAAFGGIVVDEDNNTVNIRSNSVFSPNSVKIQVPRRTTLMLKIATDGDIKIEQVHGEIEASIISGNVTLTDVAGSVVAHALNGDVNVTLKETDPDKPMSFSSMTGNIDVSFPEDLKADVSMNTINGEIYSGFDIKLDSTGGRVWVDDSEEENELRIGIDGAVKGSINGGGPEIQFKTFHGNIYIRRLSQ